LPAYLQARTLITPSKVSNQTKLLNEPTFCPILSGKHTDFTNRGFFFSCQEKSLGLAWHTHTTHPHTHTTHTHTHTHTHTPQKQCQQQGQGTLKGDLINLNKP
jgi:hypothetical protein